MKNLNWTDITLQQYRDIRDTMLNESLTDTDMMWQMINIAYNVNANEIPIQEFKKYVDGMSFVHSKMPKMKMKDTYTLNGTEYALKKELGDFSVAQFIDWQAYMQNGGDLDNAEALLSVFLIPVGHKYGEDYSIDQVKKDISTMSIADVNTVLAFFLTLSKAYMLRFLWCSEKKTMKGLKGMKKRMKAMKMYRKMIKETIRGV